MQNISNADDRATRRSPTTTEFGYELSFTRDQDLINKYKQLRHELYVSDERFVGFREFSYPEAEDYEDPDNQMLIVHNNGAVYGGVALRISTPKHPITMNLEQDIIPPEGTLCFSLKDQFPDFELSDYAYAEFDDIALHPDLREGKYVRMIFKNLLNRCIDYRVRYMFGVGDKVRTRLYRQIYINMGVEGGVHPTLDIPMRREYEGKKRYIVYGDTKKFHVLPHDPNAKRLLFPLGDYDFSDQKLWVSTALH